MAILRKFCRDNPISNRLIEHGTKALERELMSGETLRAPRQQLRPLRSAAFVFSSNYLNSDQRTRSRRVFFFLVMLFDRRTIKNCPAV
jgi:hypothetical protein